MCARRHFVSAKRDDQRLNPGEPESGRRPLYPLPAASKLVAVGERSFVTANQFSFGIPALQGDTGGLR